MKISPQLVIPEVSIARANGDFKFENTKLRYVYC